MALLKGKWVTNYTLNETKVKLQNDQFLLGRDALDSSDLSLLKVNASDLLEFGIEPIWGTAPTLPQSLVNKDYVDSVVFGMRDPKDAVRVAANVNIDIANAPATIDGITMVNGDRVLLPKQTTASQNGIYVYNGVGVALTRSEDADSDAEVTQGLSCLVTEGTIHGRTNWVLTTPDPIVLDTTALTFARVPNLGSVLGFRNLVYSVNATDVANGYIDLAHSIINESIIVAPIGGPIQEVGVDYSLSVPVTTSRLTFAGDLALYIADGDKLIVSYSYEVA